MAEDLKIKVGIDASEGLAQADQQVEGFIRKPRKLTVGVDAGGSMFNPQPTSSGGIQARSNTRDVEGVVRREVGPVGDDAAYEKRLQRLDRLGYGTPAQRRELAANAGASTVVAVEPVAREAIVRRAESEKRVAAANDRLANATNAAAGRGGSGVGGDDGEDDGMGRKGPRGGIRPRGRSLGIPLGALGSIGTLGTVVRGAEVIAEAFMDRAIETRLAIAPRGGEDSLRRTRAELAFRESIGNAIPIVGRTGVAINELATGDREYAQGMIESAERQKAEDERKRQLGEVKRDTREFLYGAAAGLYPRMGASDPMVEARRSAEAERRQSLRAIDYREGPGLASITGPNALAERKEMESQFAELRDGIEKAFSNTTHRIAVQSRFRTREIEDEIAVNELVGKRQPLSGQAEAIYRRGTLQAAQLGEQGRESDQKLALQLTAANLKAFRATAFNGGTAQEVAAGSFGPQGTQGTDQAGADYSAALGRIEQLLGRTESALRALGGVP